MVNDPVKKMTMHKNIFIVFFFLLLIGCEKETLTPLKGNLEGFIRLVDGNGKDIADKSNVKVTLTDKISVISNADGKFSFNDIPLGTYKLIYEKDGFGTRKAFNIDVAGGNLSTVIGITTLIQFCSLEVSNLKIEPIGNLRVRVTGSITPTQEYSVFCYFSHDPNVSNLKYDCSDGIIATSNIKMSTIDLYSLANCNKFEFGEKIYVAIYVAGLWHDDSIPTSYYDYELDANVRSDLKKVTGEMTVALN